MSWELLLIDLVGLYTSVVSPITYTWLKSSYLAGPLSIEKCRFRILQDNVRFSSSCTEANQGAGAERELAGKEISNVKLNALLEAVAGWNKFRYVLKIETGSLIHNSIFSQWQLLVGCYLKLIALDHLRRLIEYNYIWLEIEEFTLPFEQSSRDSENGITAFAGSLTCPDLEFLLNPKYASFETEACKSGKLQFGSCNRVALLPKICVITEQVLNVESSILLTNRNGEPEQTLQKLPWIQEVAKTPKRETSGSVAKPTGKVSSTSEPPPAEQEPEERKPETPAPKKDPRVVHEPVRPYHGLELGSRVDGFLLHPGDIMITHWCRPPYDPPTADHMANPGGHCTLFVDHGFFERRQAQVYDIEHMMDKCFDDRDMVLRFGSFDLYWSWSALNPVECFEFQYHTPPASWFVFSRVQAKTLPRLQKTWNRRWQVVGRQQPDPPDTQAITPRLGDLIIRRAEAVVWWRPRFQLRTGDLLLRVRYKRISFSSKTLAAVEMYECTINSSKEFTGRSYVTVYGTNWKFLGKDVQFYGEDMIGTGGQNIRYNGPLEHPLSNRNDIQGNEFN